jgi:hypothetical protein
MKGKKAPAPVAVKKAVIGKAAPAKGAAAGARKGGAPPLRFAATPPQAVELLKAKSDDEKILHLNKLFGKAMGEESALNMSTPHTAEHHVIVLEPPPMSPYKELGVLFVLKKWSA